MSDILRPPRVRNDCVVRFLSIAAESLLGPAVNGEHWFKVFADKVRKDWAEIGELPLLNGREARTLFDGVMSDAGKHLSLDVTRFRDIPYEGYFEFAKMQMEEGKCVGLGYRSAPIFGGSQDALHVSTVGKVFADRIHLQDADLAPDYTASWEKIEAAVLSADSGFWVVAQRS